MEIYLIRHTTPLITTGVCYGQSDIPVGDGFVRESKKIIEALPPHIDAIYSSTLTRCTKLSEKIISKNKKQYSLEYVVDKRLIEMNFGRWEMMNWSEINREEFNHWENDVILNSVPGGESFFNLKTRVNDFLQTLIKTNHNTVVVITHAGVIRCFLSLINNIPLAETIKITIGYGSVNVLTI